MKTQLLLFTLAVLTFSVARAQNDTMVVSTSVKDTVIITDDVSVSFLTDLLSGILDASKKQGKRDRPASVSYAGWHSEPYFGFGFVAGGVENSDAELLYGGSYSIDFGIKSRYQFTGIYSTTFNLGFMHNRYKISNGIANNIIGMPSPTAMNNFVVNSEKFRTWAFSASFGHRFNFTKTRNVKNYVEASAYGNYNFSRQYIVDYKGDGGANADVYYGNDNIFQPFEAGVQLNLGFHWFSIWGRYRLTDWFNSDYTATKMPRWVVGVAISGI